MNLIFRFGVTSAKIATFIAIKKKFPYNVLLLPESSVFSEVFSQKLLQAIKILIELNPCNIIDPFYAGPMGVIISLLA